MTPRRLLRPKVGLLAPLFVLRSTSCSSALLALALEQARQPVLFAVLVGTMADRARDRKVPLEEAKAAARAQEVPYVEVCANESLQTLVDTTLKAMRRSTPAAAPALSSSGASFEVPASVPSPASPAPQWVPDEAVKECAKCKHAFTATRRRHHCRVCLNIFCAACSSKRVAHQRVCDSCFSTQPKKK